MTYVPFTFDAVYKGEKLFREEVMLTDTGRSRIWGEYLRILHYEQIGDILALEKEID